MRSLLTLSRVTYSPNTTTNKKPAQGGLEKAQGDAGLLASYNNQIGRPVGMYSGTIGGLLADAGLVPTAFVAVTEQL